jgi:DNA polymerase-3 subunit delta'
MEIIGHKKIINFFTKALAKNSLSHAYIFSGPDGVGKFTLALDLAEKILKEKVVVGDNLIIVKPEIEETKDVIKKKDIIIDQIRDLQRSLSLSSGASKFRLAIIDEADRMNVKAQNAFLKTLEEAAEGVILILIVRDEKNLLATIFSRCQRIKFGIVSAEELEVLIPLGTANKTELITLAMGRPGILTELLSNENELAFYKNSLRELQGIFGQNVGERFALAESMAKNAEMASKKMNLWITSLRDAVLGKSQELKVNQVKALKFMESLEKNLGLLNRNNFNTRLILENMFLDL